MVEETPLLIICAKYPEVGAVKTRLGQRIGMDAAVRAYKEMAEWVWGQTTPRGCEYERWLYIHPASRIADSRSWLGATTVLSQQGGDLGTRLKRVLNRAPVAQRKIIIGTDCLGVNRGLLLDAFCILRGRDAVIGPTTDGGYYLLGLKRVPELLFSGIAWSTETVFQRTMDKLRMIAYDAAVLPTLSDID